MKPDGSMDESNEREQAYSPLVRRLAEEFSVDLSIVAGTGPGGRVTRADVQRAADGETTASAVPGTLRVAEVTDLTITVDEVQPEQTESRAPQDAPSAPAEVSTFTVFFDIDAEQLLRAHRRLAEDRDEELPLIAVVARLAVAAYDLSDELHRDPGPVSLMVTRSTGASVAIDGAERLSLIELSGRLTIVEAVPADPPPSPELTIDDLIATGARSVTPVLPPSATLALAVGCPQSAVRIIGGQVREAAIMTLAATFDANLVTTGVGARLLAAIASNLEDPILAFAD